jgi:hypothetical protein
MSCLMESLFYRIEILRVLVGTKGKAVERIGETLNDHTHIMVLLILIQTL